MNLSSYLIDFLINSPVKNRELTSSNRDTTSAQSIHQFSEDDNFDGRNEYFVQDLLSPNANTPLEDSSKNSKPRYSFINMIKKAVLSKKNRKIVLQDIYQYIMKTFPFYNNKEKAWRNSVRHNLSINECFIKIGRSGNGKGNFWSIHPAYIDDFIKGDFRLRQARRRTKHKMVRGPTRYNSGYIPLAQLPTEFHQCLSDRPTMQDSYQSLHQRSVYGHEMMRFPTTGEPTKSDYMFLSCSDFEKIKKNSLNMSKPFYNFIHQNVTKRQYVMFFLIIVNMSMESVISEFMYINSYMVNTLSLPL